MPWFVLLAIISMLLAVVFLVTPFAVALIAGLLIYRWYRTNPGKQEQEYRQLTVQLYEEVKRNFTPPEVEWSCPAPFVPIAQALLAEEIGPKRIPPPPLVCNSIEGARYRDQLARMGSISNESLAYAFRAITECLTPFVRIYEEAEEACDYEADTAVPIEYFLEDKAEMVQRAIVSFYAGEGFISLCRTLDRNLTANKDLFPTEYRGDDVVNAYLKGTPLTKLFDIKIPFAIPDQFRTEHHFILGGTGHGKTQCLQHYIADDVQRAIYGEISLIVIDSQGDLINKVRKMKGLHGSNTVIIDPEDVAFPVSLNLFDVKQERLDGYSPVARERQLNGIIELYDYVLGSLLSAEMTQKQEVLFRYVTRLLLTVPGATIHTMLDLFQDGAMERYETYIDELDPVAQTFFRTEFASRDFSQTRRQVVRRLYGILENQAFTRMFSHPESKLDLFTEMNSGKVILINTAKSLLKEEGTEIFGRFFIAMITQAAQEREELNPSERLPCFVYIDEANDYRFDEKIDVILTQARKYNVGLTMATQYLDKISPRLQAAIAANTAIKFAGGASNRDAKRMAPDMRCAPEFIEAQPTLSFAAYVRGLTPRAIPLAFEPGYLERKPKASEEELAELLAANRAKYATPIYHEPEEPDPHDPNPEESDPDEPGPEPKPGPINGDGFTMAEPTETETTKAETPADDVVKAEAVPEHERMPKPKTRRKPPPADPDNVPELGEW